MKGNDFIINVARIPPDGKDYEFVITNDWIVNHLGELERSGVFSTGESGLFNVKVSPVGSNFYIKGSAVLKLRMRCVRCLRDIVIEVKVPFSIFMVRGARRGVLPAGIDRDIGISRFNGMNIVLDEEVREAIILELPMNPKCHQGCSVEDLYK